MEAEVTTYRQLRDRLEEVLSNFPQLEPYAESIRGLLFGMTDEELGATLPPNVLGLIRDFDETAGKTLPPPPPPPPPPLLSLKRALINC